MPRERYERTRGANVLKLSNSTALKEVMNSRMQERKCNEKHREQKKVGEEVVEHCADCRQNSGGPY